LPKCSLQSSAESISFPHDSHLSYINYPILALVSKLINVFFLKADKQKQKKTLLIRHINKIS